MQDWLQKKERNQRRSPHLQSFGRRRRRLSEICPTTCLWDSIKDDPGELHFEGPGLQEGWDPGELLFRAQGLQGELHDGVTMTAKVFTNSMMKDAWQSMVLPMVSLGLVATWKKTPQKSQALIGTLSMTDSGGFPPGTPVSTHLLKYYTKERKKEIKRE